MVLCTFYTICRLSCIHGYHISSSYIFSKLYAPSEFRSLEDIYVVVLHKESITVGHLRHVILCICMIFQSVVVQMRSSIEFLCKIFPLENVPKTPASTRVLLILYYFYVEWCLARQSNWSFIVWCCHEAALTHKHCEKIWLGDPWKYNHENPICL